MEMKTYKVEEFCTEIIDCPHSTPVWKDSGIRVIRNFNIKKGTLDFSDGYYVDEDTYLERTKRALPESDDLVISREAPMGEVCIIPKNLKCCLGQRLVLLKVNREKCFPKYLLYMMQSKYVQEQIGIINKTGSIVSNLNIPDLKALKIPYRPIESQQKIAAVLSALDDKIALNRRIDAKLEAMAKRLYDYWFVQFDFPTEDGKPYKSSGGKMAYNETLKREIPVGWEVKRLAEVCNFPMTRVSEKKVSNKIYVPIEVIPRNEMSFSETANIEKAATGLCSFEKRDILLSNRRVYFHKVCIAPFEGITRDTVIIINPKDFKNLGFIYQIVNSNHFIDYATLNSYGSEQPVLSTPTVQDYKFVCPNMGFDKTYSEKVNGIINKVLENNLEIRKLTAMRDRLLPLLMNGQVEVE